MSYFRRRASDLDQLTPSFDYINQRNLLPACSRKKKVHLCKFKQQQQQLFDDHRESRETSRGYFAIIMSKERERDFFYLFK
jgi:hypothetical protein